MFNIKTLIFLSLIALISSETHANFSIKKYNGSSSITQMFKFKNKLISNNIKVDSVIINKHETSCGLVYNIKPYGSSTFEENIKDIIKYQFSSIGILDDQLPSIKLDIIFNEFYASTPKFILPGEWRFSAIIKSSNGNQVTNEISHSIQVLSGNAISGCNAVAENFPIAIEKFLNQLGNSPNFDSLFALTESEANEFSEKVKSIRDAKIASENARIEAEIASKNAQIEAEITSDKLKKEAIEMRKQKIAESLEKLQSAEKLALVKCSNKSDCDRIFALTQIYISDNSDMKIQLATDIIIESYNSTEPMKISAKAVKIPLKNNFSIIKLHFTCNASDSEAHFDYCIAKRVNLYQNFANFLRLSD